MNIFEELRYRKLESQTRRHFIKQCSIGLGGLAFAAMTGCNPFSSSETGSGGVSISDPFAPKSPHFIPKAKRIIYMHMAGAPSQLELFDFKPELQKMHGQDAPPSLMEGNRFAFIQGVPKMMGPQANFKNAGNRVSWYLICCLIFLPLLMKQLLSSRCIRMILITHQPSC
jgi:hypothetical protein